MESYLTNDTLPLRVLKLTKNSLTEQSDTTALGTRVTNVESSVTALGTRVDNAESAISANSGSITTINTTLTSINTSITSLETRMDSAESNITAFNNRFASQKITANNNLFAWYATNVIHGLNKIVEIDLYDGNNASLGFPVVDINNNLIYDSLGNVINLSDNKYVYAKYVGA